MSGKLVIFSAPSGSGKTSIVRKLLEINPKLEFSISACTRDKRGRTEKDGQDYHFLTQEEFKKKIDEDAFVEWQEVYPGAFYGTLKEEINRIWSEGKTAIFDVDVKGGLNLKKIYGEKALAIFVKVPSLEALKQRLQERGTESDDNLSRRMYKAEFEMKFEPNFDISLLNDNLEESVQKADELIRFFISK